MSDFKFDYGVVTYKHRFSIHRSLDDYKETTLSKCIRMGIQYKYKTMACDNLIAEMQIVYKDEHGKLHCLWLATRDLFPCGPRGRTMLCIAKKRIATPVCGWLAMTAGSRWRNVSDSVL